VGPSGTEIFRVGGHGETPRWVERWISMTGTRPLPGRPRVQNSESGEWGEPRIKSKKRGIYLRIGNGSGQKVPIGEPGVGRVGREGLGLKDREQVKAIRRGLAGEGGGTSGTRLAPRRIIRSRLTGVAQTAG